MAGAPRPLTEVEIKTPERKIWPWVLIAVCVVLGLGVYSCVRALSSAGRESDEAMKAFHTALDQKSCSQIYTSATPDFRQTTSEEDWNSLCAKIPEKMGTFVSTERQFVNLNATTSGKFLTVTYASVFSLGKGDEKFVWKYDGTQLKLHGYTINSPGLLK